MNPYSCQHMRSQGTKLMIYLSIVGLYGYESGWLQACMKNVKWWTYIYIIPSTCIYWISSPDLIWYTHVHFYYRSLVYIKFAFSGIVFPLPFEQLSGHVSNFLFFISLAVNVFSMMYFNYLHYHSNFCWNHIWDVDFQYIGIWLLNVNFHL